MLFARLIYAGSFVKNKKINDKFFIKMQISENFFNFFMKSGE